MAGRFSRNWSLADASRTGFGSGVLKVAFARKYVATMPMRDVRAGSREAA